MKNYGQHMTCIVKMVVVMAMNDADARCRYTDSPSSKSEQHRWPLFYHEILQQDATYESDV